MIHHAHLSPSVSFLDFSGVILISWESVIKSFHKTRKQFPGKLSSPLPVLVSLGR